MKEFTIEEKTYTVPEKWEDVSLRTYLRLSEVKDDDNEQFKALILISHYTQIPLEVLKRMSLKELHKISACMQFINTEIKTRDILKITIDGEKYNVMESLLLEQAQDYFALEAILSESKDNTIHALPKILAVVCKKDNETLDTIDINKREQLFLDKINIVDAMSLQVFFSNVGMMYKLSFLLYSNRDEIFQQKVKEVENTLTRLDGMGCYSKLLKKTLQSFLTYYTESWKMYSSSTHSSSKETNTSTILKRLLKRNLDKKTMDTKSK